MTMDKIDRQILNIIQARFPVTERPFKALGDEIGISEDEVIEHISSLKESGIIRRIGATFDPRKLGFVSTLCAAQVPSDTIDHFVRVVNSYSGVTHNYERNHKYNIWFTFIAESMGEIEEKLSEISSKTGIKIRSLPTIKFFKIRVNFKV